jgi:glycosyltransferase involved in cell wall biosynthesis
MSLDLIVCTYNHAALLDRVLNAIAQQQVSTEIDWGVLIVNNNCTDETEAIVAKYLQSGTIPNLRIILETRQGLNYARRCGVQNTNRDWLAFVDDDCVLATDWIEQAIAFALTHPDCGAFGGRVILSWERQPKSFVKQFGYCFAEQNHGEMAKQVDCLVGAGIIINRSVLLTTGWLEKQYLQDRIGKKLVSGGDVELALRLGSKDRLWYNPNCKLNHLIPSQRTKFQYLLKINYGLGISQVLGDSLLWSSCDRSWFFVFVRQAIDFSADVLINSIKALFGRKSKAVAALNLSFLFGKWMGIWRLLTMNRQKRDRLLGCAKVIR